MLLWNKSVENCHLSHQLQVSSRAQRSMDFLFLVQMLRDYSSSHYAKQTIWGFISPDIVFIWHTVEILTLTLSHEAFLWLLVYSSRANSVARSSVSVKRVFSENLIPVNAKCCGKVTIHQIYRPFFFSFFHSLDYSVSTFLFSFLLTRDPRGLKVSKIWLFSQPNHLVNVLCYNPHKRYFLVFWNFKNLKEIE